MHNLRLALLAAGLLSTVGAIAQPAPPPPAPPFTLTSPSFADGGVLPDKYTQASPTPVSPALSWDNAPAGAASFTLVLHDLDGAPNKGVADTLHWLAFNIPATARALPEGVATLPQLPDGTIQPNNVAGLPGFRGPGARGVYHHYIIELYALDIRLALGPSATRAEVMAAMEGHVIGKAALESRFHR